MGTTTNTYRGNIAAADLRLPDHFPECPHCFDLNEPGATICAACCYRLVPTESELSCRPSTSA